MLLWSWCIKLGTEVCLTDMNRGNEVLTVWYRQGISDAVHAWGGEETVNPLLIDTAPLRL